MASWGDGRFGPMPWGQADSGGGGGGGGGGGTGDVVNVKEVANLVARGPAIANGPVFKTKK